MKPKITFFFILVCSIVIYSQANEQGFISAVISEKGLDFIKELLVTKAISSIKPLQLPQIEKIVKIPSLGILRVVFSNITVYEVNVSSSHVKLGETGIAIIASGATCNLSMNWYYSYSTWFSPVEISDKGRASVQVEGMEVGLTLGLENQGGTLKLTLFECGCYVKDIFIQLDGGASWFYQMMVDAFEGKIGAAVEHGITKKLTEGIIKLDSLLQALPKEVPVYDAAALNVTFMNEPVFSSSSLTLEINGLLMKARKAIYSNYHHKHRQHLASCNDLPKTLGILLDEAVFNSASSVYFNADLMHFIVDELPEQSLLNTAGWRFIIPQLYRKYPNDDMNLNISLSSPPVIKISENKIDGSIYADLIIDVLESNQVIPVICISLEIQGSGLVKISENNVVGSVKLKGFTMTLKWSKVGNLRMFLIQPIMWTIIQTVFLPYANLHLGKGFPLPIVHGFTLQNAEIICSSSLITVCSDVIYEESLNLAKLSLFSQ
ncbi:Lipid-binding serum glycoprotein, N-terminal [Dillenia turbinata]|uniref:Lipid-binding serum glycoprotein, N-terminal n=1 Tax=Dillenia turbinata TaxID=194707 RepID=A0AAN8UKZ2_9MAGN